MTAPLSAGLSIEGLVDEDAQTLSVVEKRAPRLGPARSVRCQMNSLSTAEFGVRRIERRDWLIKWGRNAPRIVQR